MGFLQLPKQFIPGFRHGQLPCNTNVALDDHNYWGRHTVWAFYPGMYDEMPPVNNWTDGDMVLGTTLGQRMQVISFENQNGATKSVEPVPSNSWGYTGLASNTDPASASGNGIKYRFGAGDEGMIDFPNKQNVTFWGLVIPNGADGSTGNDDPRIFSRDSGTSANAHRYMIGGVESGGTTKARIRLRTTSSASTTTLVIGTQFWQADSLNFIAGTYNGDTIQIHHIREDGGYESNSTSSNSGDIDDDNTSNVGLAVGANYNNDNQFEGRILGVGVLDYAENDEFRLRQFAHDVTQMLKPTVDPVYFPVLATGGDTNVNATLDTLTLTDFNTTIARDKNISATTDTLTFTDFNTTVKVSVNVQATLDTLTITDFNTTIARDKNVQATLDTLTITDFNTTVTVSGATNVNATLDTLTLTDFNVTVLQDKNIQATLDTLVLIDYPTTVTIGADVIGGKKFPEWLFLQPGLLETALADRTKEYLELQGFTEALNDSKFDWLRGQGRIGAFNDMFYTWKQDFLDL